MTVHPEVPRVEFYGDGYSMNVEQATERFRSLLVDYARQAFEEGDKVQWTFDLHVELRPCDCDSDITGRGEYCPLHGDKA